MFPSHVGKGVEDTVFFYSLKQKSTGRSSSCQGLEKSYRIMVDCNLTIAIEYKSFSNVAETIPLKIDD